MLLLSLSYGHLFVNEGYCITEKWGIQEKNQKILYEKEYNPHNIKQLRGTCPGADDITTMFTILY